MANLARTLKDLRQERHRAQREVERLDEVISVLQGFVWIKGINLSQKSCSWSRSTESRYLNNIDMKSMKSLCRGSILSMVATTLSSNPVTEPPVSRKNASPA